MGQRPPYSGIPQAVQDQIAAEQNASSLFDNLLRTFLANGGQIAATPSKKHGTSSDFPTNTI